MSWCSRLTRLAVCFFLCTTLLAQDRKDRDYDDRGDHGEHRDSDRDSDRDRDHPHTSRLDYLILPNFSGARDLISLSPNLMANSVSVIPFYLNRSFRVGHVSLSVLTPQAGSHAYAGIYDAHGNLLVQGKFATDAIANLTLDVTPRVSLKPGMYYFAIGAEDTVSQGAGLLFDEPALSFIRAGTATNQIMGGSLPATLGPIIRPLQGSTASAVFTP